MKQAHVLATALEKRLRGLASRLDAALAGGGEPLHQARVASRRLREALPLLSPAGGGRSHAAAGLAAVRGAVRDLTRALGGVRELDVSLERLAEIAGRDASTAPAAALVRAALERERETRFEAMRGAVEAMDTDRLVRQTRAIARTARVDSDAQEAGSGAVTARTARRAGRLEAAILAAGTVYAPDRLHAVRIAVKQLRYVLELIQELEIARTALPVRRLRNVQDLLGRMHDLEVLAESGRTVLSGLSPADEARPGLRQLVSEIERRIGCLHADYVTARNRLLRIAALWQVSPGARPPAKVRPGRPTAHSPALKTRATRHAAPSRAALAASR